MNALLPPVLLLAVLLVVAYASLFHLWTGRTLRDLPIYLLAASLGFVVGQIVGGLTELPWLQIGRLHVIEASIGAWLALVIVRIVSQPQPTSSGDERG